MVEPLDIRAIALALVAAVSISGCAGPQTSPARSPAATVSSRPQSTPATSVTEIALSMVGTPYVYGGADPQGFDCSGLVWYAYKTSGIEVPRTSLDLYRRARKIRLDDAAPGDLVFFQDEASLSHVGIFLGGDRFVHAPASGRRVSVANLSEPYYRMHLVGVGRIVEL